MTDATTQQHLHVSTDGTVGAYLMLPVIQLDDVKTLLDRHRIHYWVEENAISLNGSPEIATINFGRGVSASAVQTILDGVR